MVPAWWSLTVPYDGNPAQLEKKECEQTSEWACQARAHRLGVCIGTELESEPPRLDGAEEVEPHHRPRGPRLCGAPVSLRLCQVTEDAGAARNETDGVITPGHRRESEVVTTKDSRPE